jgi:hypothetical protein
MRRWGVWVLIAGCVAVATLPLVPPSPDSDKFSATRAISHVTEISHSPHPIGSLENERVRSYLIGALADLGLSPQTQTVPVMDYFGTPGNTVDVVNVFARVKGTGEGDAVALVAHFDTVPATPGANDDSVSVAILLEVAQALVTSPPFENDVILLFTDGEEPNPRFGSQAFIDEQPWFHDVVFVVNLEAIGSSGSSILAEVSGPTSLSVNILAESTEHPLAFSFFTQIASLIGGFGTDFDPFREADVPGVAFAYLHGSPVYHTDQDSIENVNLRSVQHQGSNTLALTRYLADADLRPPPDAGDSVFFTVGRWIVVRYPTAWSVPISLVALLVLGVAVFRGFRPARWFRGVGIALGAFVAAAVAGALIWMLITSIRTTPGIWESYLYLAALLAGTEGLWWLLATRIEPDAALFGVVSVWLLLALVTTVLAPGMSYLFTWPALAGSLLVFTKPRAPVWSLLAVSLVSLAVTVPIIDLLFQMTQPRPGNPDSELVPIAGAVTALAILVMGLIHSVWQIVNRQPKTATP